MDDTTILNWLEESGESLHAVSINGEDFLILGWLNEKCVYQQTYGHDLRDAVCRAAVGETGRKNVKG